MISTYKRFWALSLNTSEKDNRVQFGLPLIINIGLLILLMYAINWIEKINYNIIFLPIIILLFLILIYPVLSSAMRRINDVGKDNVYYAFALQMYKVVLGLLVVLLLIKIFFSIDLLIVDSSMLCTLFFTIMMLLVLLYALLPSNYFKQSNHHMHQ
ncbi:hypothetical protein [Macrococcus capreoli]|uniref:hypothetical protein n=1 Tax=Macrococcus capreoli TaxID=2982690 RepID=UPI003EE69F90